MKDFKVVLDETHGVMRTDALRLPRRASYSSLDTYGNCPAQWAFGRLWRQTPEWDDPLIVGSIAHAALELAVGTPSVPDPSWLQLTRRAIEVERERSLRPENRWKGDPIPAGVKAPNGVDATDEDWARLAANRLNGFRLSDVFDGAMLSPAAAEQHIDADIWGIPMTGSVDYRDMSGRVVDWKTGRLPDPGSPKASSHQSQLRVYKALLGTRDIHVTDARDVYVEHRAYHMADLSADAMEATAKTMKARWDGMRRDVDAGSYALTPSYLCPWCPLARVCPMAWRARGDKARKAAARGIDPSDPRVRVSDFRPTGDPLAGMFGDACERTDENVKEPVMDLLDMLEPAAKPAKPTPQPVEEHHPDPWATPAGHEAAARWGLEDTAMLGGEPKDRPKPKSKRLMVRGKAYDPSVLTGGAVNSAGYGFTRLTVMAAEAYALDPDHVEATLLALIRAGWAASRAAWGENAPDVAGLKEGRPDGESLLAWLDSPLARDADEAINRLVGDMDGTPVERIGKAGRAAAQAFGAARALIA